MTKNQLIILTSFFIVALAVVLWLLPWENRVAQESYEKHNYSHSQKILEKLQADSPKDPLVSFNLGTTNYRLGNFKEAKTQFLRSADLSRKQSKNTEFEAKAHTNAGNCMHQEAVKGLEQSGKTKKNIEAAIDGLDEATGHYQMALEQNPQDKIAKSNNRITENLLEQLKKELEEEAEKPDTPDKPDKSNKNTNDKEQTGDQSQNKDKSNIDKSCPDNQNQSESTCDKQQSSSKNSTKQNQQGKKSESKSSNTSSQDKSEMGNQDKKPLNQQDLKLSGTDEQPSETEENDEYGQQRSESNYGEQSNKTAEGQNNLGKEHPTEDEDGKDVQHDKNKHPDSSDDESDTDTSDQDSKTKNGSQSSKNLETQNVKNEASYGLSGHSGNIQQQLEDRGINLLLDQLDSGEAKLQKRRIQLQCRGSRPIKARGQKAW